MKNNKITKEFIKELAADIMLDLTETEIEKTLAAEEMIKKRFEKVTSINTDNIEPLSYPFEQIHTFLRDDESSYKNDQKDLLANAPSTDGDFITIVKVVK